MAANPGRPIPPMNRPKALTLRPACRDEAPAMAALSRELIETGLAWRYTPSRVAELIADRETLAVVARDDRRIVGFGAMQFGDEHAHLQLLCVRRACQRRGIGVRLVHWMLASARVAGIASVDLELRSDNAQALAFYRALGCTEVGWLPGYYDGRVDARRMRLQLREAGAADPRA